MDYEDDDMPSFPSVLKVIIAFVIAIPLLFAIFATIFFLTDSGTHTASDPISHISIYVADDAPQESINKLSEDIRNIDGVREVNFITKAQALENFANSIADDSGIIEQLDGENPLPASIDVKVSEDKADEIISILIDDGLFKSICSNPDNPEDSVIDDTKTIGHSYTKVGK